MSFGNFRRNNGWKYFRQHFQPADQRTNGGQDRKRLAEAANLLLADYREDKELTGFTVLDGEPFYAQV
jgi:hypothetical protein